MTRHTYATDVLDATEGNLYAVKELLGHSSTRVTETYLALVPDAHAGRRRGPRRVPEMPPAKTSLFDDPETPAYRQKKATSGFEPLYEALQASA